MSGYLVVCIVGCALVTALPRVLPLMYLSLERLPLAVKNWLGFVPVAVMAALLGPGVLVRDGVFSPGPDNIFLVVAVPALVVSWYTRSFFGTIAFGMGGVALLRYLGWGV